MEKIKEITWQDCYLKQIEKSLKIVSNLTFNWMFIEESSLIDEKHWKMMEMNNKDDILYCKSMLIVNALKEAEICHGWSPFIPRFEFTTDNAGMIAIVGHLKYLNNNYANQTVMATARLKL